MLRPGQTLDLVATCSRGVEEVLAAELRSIGAAAVAPGRGMVSFRGDLAAVYEANLRLRTAMRVLVRLAEGQVRDRDGLYRLAWEIPWEELLALEDTFRVDAVGGHPAFADSRFPALVVKDAVADRLRRRRGGRPDVDRMDPSVSIHLHLSRSRASLALDSSGEPLSHRGYRPRGGPAPVAESLAAALLLLAGYDGSMPLYDPMCGTGTFLAEAALIAGRIAPGIRRRFAVEGWPAHRPALLDNARSRAAAVSTPHAVIAGADGDERAVRAARRNLQEAGVAAWVEVRRAELAAMTPPGEAGLIVTNPPWGHRIGDVETLRPFYRAFGDALKNRARGWTAWVLLGERELAREIGLKPSRRIPVFNGPVECRFCEYRMW